MGVLVRMAALITIRAYVATGGKDANLNKEVVATLRAPSDGAWLSVAQRLSAVVDDKKVPLAGLVRDALAARPAAPDEVKERARDGGGEKAKTVQQALQALVSFRNALVHGENITDADLDRAKALLEISLRGFVGLADYRLEVLHEGVTWSLNGAVPRHVEGGDGLEEGQPSLVHREREGEVLSLSPLLRFKAGAGEDALDVDFDELFFLNAGSLERLSYIGYRADRQLDGKSLGSYEAFKEFMSKIPTPPIPQEPRIDFSGLAAFHSRLFVGRSDVLKELAAFVAEPPTQYGVLKALAGMGKTAIFSSLLQASLNREVDESRRIASPADGLLREGDRWVFHFCMPTDGRNSPTVALRSLISQICDHFDIKRDSWLSHDLDELKDQHFPALLAQASSKLGEGERLVVVVDALDEGIGAEKESVPSCIPAGTYDGVVFLLSYRVDEDKNNSRVTEQMKALPDERLATLATADPLSGLVRGDVDLFLKKVADLTPGSEVADSVRDATWSGATADAKDDPPTADPFYLRFVADGVQSGAIRLDRPETVPESLDDAFEEMWMGLPTEREFLCHRVLLTLGIMREYGDDELFAALFNRDLPDDRRLTIDEVAAVRVKAGKLLVYDGDRYGLFHDRFRRFLVGEQKDPIAEALGQG